MKSAFTSSAVAAAAGLPVRNGSISTRLPSLSSSKHACPSQQSRVAMIRLSGEEGFGPRASKLFSAVSGRRSRACPRRDAYYFVLFSSGQALPLDDNY